MNKRQRELAVMHTEDLRRRTKQVEDLREAAAIGIPVNVYRDLKQRESVAMLGEAARQEIEQARRQSVEVLTNRFDPRSKPVAGLLNQALLLDSGEGTTYLSEIVMAIIDRARAGDTTILKVLLDRVDGPLNRNSVPTTGIIPITTSPGVQGAEPHGEENLAAPVWEPPPSLPPPAP